MPGESVVLEEYPIEFDSLGYQDETGTLVERLTTRTSLHEEDFVKRRGSKKRRGIYSLGIVEKEYFIDDEPVFLCHSLLRVLNSQQRRLIEMMFFQNATAEDIMEELRISKDNVALITRDALNAMHTAYQARPVPAQVIKDRERNALILGSLTFGQRVTATIIH